MIIPIPIPPELLLQVDENGRAIVSSVTLDQIRQIIREEIEAALAKGVMLQPANSPFKDI